MRLWHGVFEGRIGIGFSGVNGMGKLRSRVRVRLMIPNGDSAGIVTPILYPKSDAKAFNTTSNAFIEHINCDSKCLESGKLVESCCFHNG